MRGDDPEFASPLQFEERELEAAELGLERTERRFAIASQPFNASQARPGYAVTNSGYTATPGTTSPTWSTQTPESLNPGS